MLLQIMAVKIDSADDLGSPITFNNVEKVSKHHIQLLKIELLMVIVTNININNKHVIILASFILACTHLIS